MTVPVQDVRVRLTGGTEDDPPVYLYVEARQDGGAPLLTERALPGGDDEEVSNRVIDGAVQGMEQAFEAIRVVGSEAADAVKKIAPDKFSIELNFEFTATAGGIVAALVRTGGTASIKVTLEWDRATAATST